MRHFEQVELAERYQRFRPRVRGDALSRVDSSLRTGRPIGLALDVACGTGHSTRPLAAIAERVLGLDISAAMLQDARRENPDLGFALGSAEHLPVRDEAAGLLSVGFAVHWFDAERFVREAARVLEPGARLVTYNFYFTGRMDGDTRYREWHEHVYLSRFPTPSRHWTPLPEVLAGMDDPPLRYEGHEDVANPVAFSAYELRNYLTTQSNIDAVLRQHETLAEIDAWLDAELAQFFAGGSGTFAYPGRVEVFVKEG